MRPKLRLLTLVLLSVACARHEAAKAPAAEGFGKLSIDEVAAKIGTAGVYLFDNNRREEYAQGHVPTARWVDFKNVTASDLPADKDATLIFYCHNEL
jgi:hypothetical protein